MRTPKVTLPEEDPAAKAAREREQARAENARTEETQALLLGNTVRRLRRFGAVGGGSGSVPLYSGRPAAPAGAMSTGTGGGSGFGSSGGGGGTSSRFGNSLAVLY